MRIRALAALAVLALSATPSMAHVLECKASWYSLPGQTMANGEVFNPKAAIVAHKTIPLGEWVRVTNVDEHSSARGASICAQVQDRGPYRPGRCFDVSKPLAIQLGVLGPGTVKVKGTIGCDS